MLTLTPENGYVPPTEALIIVVGNTTSRWSVHRDGDTYTLVADGPNALPYGEEILILVRNDRGELRLNAAN
jgi:hypothetical protein